jgi:hypothetical protein
MSWIWILIGGVWIAPVAIAASLFGCSLASRPIKAWLQRQLFG